ncbi:MAG: septation ring formation regulator EzrA, partial [Erysipelotrichaceae bacterium]
KLQVILNDIKISIHKQHLPSVSIKYQEDLQYANLYVQDVIDALERVPLEVSDLNDKVKIAIDYVYKLYNNVNNLVGVAALVEETITLGNRYRSTLPDVDSQLTRAELCFRNGEYTKALKIAVATIEKIHPGAYEKILAKAPASA